MAQLVTRADGEAAHHLGLQGALPTSCFPLPTTSYFLPPTSYFLLPTTSYFMLPTTTTHIPASLLPLTTEHKVLFLDVLFPLRVKRVIYIDSDQLVRAVRASSTRPPRAHPTAPQDSITPTYLPTYPRTSPTPPPAGRGRVSRPRHEGRTRGDDALLHSRPQRGDARLPLLGVGLLEGEG